MIELIHADPAPVASPFDTLVKLIPLVTAVLVAAIGGWYTLRQRKRSESKPPAVGYEAMWQRMDKLESELESFRKDIQEIKDATRQGLYEISQQWPKGEPGPTLSTDTLDRLGDMIPWEWRSHIPGT